MGVYQALNFGRFNDWIEGCRLVCYLNDFGVNGLSRDRRGCREKVGIEIVKEVSEAFSTTSLQPEPSHTVTKPTHCFGLSSYIRISLASLYV